MILSPEQVADINRRWRCMLKSIAQRIRRATPRGLEVRRSERKRYRHTPNARRVRRVLKRNWRNRNKIDPSQWTLIASKAKEQRK